MHWLTNGQEASAKYVNWSIKYTAKNINDSTTYTGTVTKQDTIVIPSASVDGIYTNVLTSSYHNELIIQDIGGEENDIY
jgi:hypothetical protein